MRADFSVHDLSGVSFEGANLPDAKFYLVNCDHNTSFKGANLENTAFKASHSQIEYANMQDANLLHAHMYEVDRLPKSLTVAQIRSIEMDPETCKAAIAERTPTKSETAMTAQTVVQVKGRMPTDSMDDILKFAKDQHTRYVANKASRQTEKGEKNKPHYANDNDVPGGK